MPRVPVDPEIVREIGPARRTLALVADKWTLLATMVLDTRPQRYGELQSRLVGISPKMLSRTLRKLEDAGWVERTVVPTVPVGVQYRLTPQGNSLRTAARNLVRWAAMHPVDDDPVVPDGPAAAGVAPDDALRRKVVAALTGTDTP